MTHNILLIYTVLIFIVLEQIIASRIRADIIGKYNEYIKNSDYVNAIKLLEEIKYGLRKWEKNQLLVYLYFATNDYEKYRDIIKFNPIDDFKGDANALLHEKYSRQITEIIFMYLHDETDKANNAYEKLIKSDNDIEKTLYYINIRFLFHVLKMMYYYHNSNYAEAKRIYNYLLPFAQDSTIKTLISYYLCRIYEIEGNTEAINAIIMDTEIQNNSYIIYFNKWRDK